MSSFSTVWLLLMVMFLITEALTVTMVSLWFAGGSLAALIVALAGGSFGLQVITMLVVSTALLACLRPVVQKHFTPKLTKTNVDAIIGSHPHHVQPLELDKSGFFTAWSIGDLFNDTTDRYTKYSILLDLEITKDGETGKTKITGFSYTPIFFCYEPSGVRILRIREAMAAYECNNLNRVSKETYEEMAAALKRIESRVSK